MQYSDIEHKIVEGIITSMNENEVIVKIGDGLEGIIPSIEFRYDHSTKEGDKMEVYVKGQEPNGRISLSHLEASTMRRWEKVVSSYNNGDVIRGYVKKSVRGGLIVSVFYFDAFLPWSLIDVNPVKDIRSFIKEKIDVIIIEIDSNKRHLIVSRKKVLEERHELIKNLERGDVLQGFIQNITEYGVFVNIGNGVTGRVNTNNIAWNKIRKIDNYFIIGQKVKVVVLSTDLAKDHISLGMKQLYKDPWNEEAPVYIVGEKVKGTVVGITTFGAFVGLQPGVNGLLPLSQLSWTLVQYPEEVLNEGDEVEVEIINIDYKKKQILLSRKILEENPWNNIESLCHVGDITKGTVTSLQDYGLLVKLNNGLSAYCSYRNVSLNRYIDHSKIYNVGDIVTFRITRIDKERHKIIINIKAVEEDELNAEIEPIKNAEINKQPIKARIIDFQPDGAIYVSISKHINGFIMSHDICWQEDVKGQDCYKKGQIIEILILRLYRQEMFADCSIKNLEDTLWNNFINHYVKGDKINCIVKDINKNSSIQVTTNLGLYGIIRQEDTFLENKNPKKNEETYAEIIEIDSTKHIIYLSLRQLELEAVEEYSKQLQHGKDYNAKIVEVNDDEIIIDVDGHKGFISRDNATRSQDVSLRDIVHDGQTKKVWYLSCTDYKLQFLLKEVASKEYPKELFSKDINGILEDLDIHSNEFIFEINKEEKAINLFQARYENEDFKGEGKLLIDRFNGEQIHPSFEDDNLETGFYSGHLELRDIKERVEKKNPYLFKLVDVTKLQGDEVNPYKYEDQLAFLQQADPSTNMSIASLLDEVGINLYKNKDRMFYELLQNADDASAEQGVNMRVQITDNYVIISHNGYPFNADDFKSITSAAQSTKKNKKQSTGYKGIGFKSVFSNSSKVLIKSGGFFFMFDKNSDEFKDFKLFYGKRNEISDWNKYIRKYSSAYEKFNTTPSIPWQLLPIWVEQIPQELQNTLFSDGANVDIALKLDSNTADYNEAISKIIDSPKFMLFLRHTRGIEINNRVISKDKEGNHIFIQSTTEEGNSIESFIVVDDDKIEINDDYFKKCGFSLIKKEMVLANGAREMAIWRRLDDGTEENLSGSIPNKIAASDNTIISMAVPTDNNGVITPLTSEDENRIYAYLPLRERRFKLHFYLNADFILASDREQIQGDNLWNHFIFYNVGKKIVNWVKHVGSKEQPKYLNLLQEELFPEEGADVEDIKPLAHQFNKGYKEALNTEKFILGHDGEWHSQDEIIYDESGLSQLIDCDMFCMILGIDKKLPYPQLDTLFLANKKLLPDIEHITTTKVLNCIISLDKRSLAEERFAYRNLSIEQRHKVEGWLLKSYKDHSKKIVDILKYLPVITFNGVLKSLSDYKRNQKYIILTDDILPIKEIIEHCGLVVSSENISESPLWSIIKEEILLHHERTTFKRIISATSSSDKEEIDADEKVKLYQHYNDKGKLHNFEIKEDTFVDWPLFRNVNGRHTVYSSLARIEDGEDPYQFLSDYTLDESEYKSLVKAGVSLNDDTTVFSLIISNWDEICSKVITEELAVCLYELTNNFYKKIVSAEGIFQKEKYINLKTVFHEGKFISQDQILFFEGLTDDSPLRIILEKLLSLPIANETITTAYASTPLFNGYDSILDNNFKEEVDLTKDEVCLILDSCRDNGKDIFSKYYISASTEDKYKLVHLKKGEVNYFTTNVIIGNLMIPINTYHALLDEFKDYAQNSNNIIKGEDLVNIIFDYYTSFTLTLGVEDTSQDKCYVELQKLSQIDGIDIEKIRAKFSIQSVDGTISSKLSDIHLQENIIAGGHTFTKADLVPGQNAKIKLATDIRTKLEGLHLPKAFLDKLFGVEQSGKDAAKEVFDKLNKSNYVLENGKQLAFMLLYAKTYNTNIYSKVLTIGNNNSYQLAGVIFIERTFEFIQKDFILSEKYNGLSDYIGATFFCNNKIGNHPGAWFFDKPKIYNNDFTPIGFDLSDGEKVNSLLDFLFQFEASTINNKDKISKALQLDTKKMTLSKYALDDEVLPDNVISWINKEDPVKRTAFIHNFFNIEDEKTSSSIIRSFLSGDIETLPNDIDLSSSLVLDKTCRWITNKEIVLNDTQYKALNALLNPKLEEQIEITALQQAKTDNNRFTGVGEYTVYLYSGEMPHVVKLDGNIIYRYQHGKAFVNGHDIYIDTNCKAELDRVLLDLAAEDRGFSYKNYGEYMRSKYLHKDEETEDSSRRGYLDVGNDFGLSEDEQKDYQEEARNILLPKLRDELGIDISNAICEYSIVHGLTKNGSPIPVVIKSYLNHDSPLRINPNEWIQLMRKDSILAVRYSKNGYGWYSLNDLLKSKDEIVLSFRSDNIDKEDRIDKFAELLRFFNDVHFNFKDIAMPRPFNTDDPLDCLFNDKTNDASKADLSGGSLNDIE